MSHKVIIFVSIMILVFPNVYAQQSTDPCGTTKVDCYQESGFRLTSDPVICMNTPSDSKYPNLSLKANEFLTSSVAEWSSLLNSGGTSRIPIWKIQLVSTTSDICNITIDFLEKPSSSDSQVNIADPIGVTRYDFDNHKAQIHIYYDNIVFESYPCQPTRFANGSLGCIPVSFDMASGTGPGFWVIRYTPHYADELALDYQLQFAIRHELGHAFGLGHYITSDNENQKWISGVTDAPSIMVPDIPPEGVYNFNINTMDIEHLKSLYRTTGFSSPILPEGSTVSQPTQPSTPPTQPMPQPIPQPIPQSRPTLEISASQKYEARDWSMGEIGDAAFVDFLQWLAFKDAIKLPQTISETHSQTFIPSWVKQITKWWIQGNITDDEYLTALQYIADKGIIKI